MYQKEDQFNPNTQFNPAHHEYYKDALGHCELNKIFNSSSKLTKAKFKSI